MRCWCAGGLRSRPITGEAVIITVSGSSCRATGRPFPRLCPDTGRARLGYDRARILLDRHTGWDLHQLRHSAATHLGERNVELQTIMAKTPRRNPRSAMRYIKPGAEAVTDATDLLNLRRGHR